jgi:L,D-transpeptidase catalytic domain
LKKYLYIFMWLVSCKSSNKLKEQEFASYNNTAEIAKKALLFCKNNAFNTEFCLLADMSIHSGRNRLFLWKFDKNEAVYSFLVGHGCGNSPWGQDGSKDRPMFSNLNDSHLSSLGKYKIGARGYSNWGINIKYLLHGLEATNNNAQKRIVVLHSWEQMAEEEVYPIGSPEGWGCPTVSNNSMKIIDTILQNSNKPVLLWIYQ